MSLTILHVIDSNGIYGAETVLLNLMQEQMSLGLVPILCSIGELHEQEKPLEKEAVTRGISVCKVRLPRGLRIKSALKLAAEAKHAKADVIHVHGYKGTILLGMLPSLVFKAPVIRTLHGWTSTSKLSKIWLYEKLDLFCLKWMDCLVTVSNNQITFIEKKIKKVPVKVVENGIPPQLYSNDIASLDAKLAEFCQDSFIIGGIGRFSDEKGFRFLVEAFTKIISLIPNAKLVLFGDGEQRELLESIVSEKELKNHVLLAGYKKGAAKFLPVFNVFVLPSLSEGLPIVLLEALQAGVPVVATRVGGVPEVISKIGAGRLVDAGSISSLVKEIVDVAENIERSQKNASHAREKALTIYSSLRMAEEYTAVYNSVM